MRQRMDASFDFNLRMKDAGLVAASANAQVGGVDKILDLGASRVDGRVILDITACETDTGNEKYQIMLQLSNSATFATGVFTQSAAVLGDSTQSLETVDTVSPRRQELAFCNEINGVVYRYARLYTFVAGTIATGINYVANVVLDA